MLLFTISILIKYYHAAKRWVKEACVNAMFVRNVLLYGLRDVSF